MPTAAQLVDGLDYPPESVERPLGRAEYVPRVVLGDPAAVPGLVEPGGVDINMRPVDEKYVAQNAGDETVLISSNYEEPQPFGIFKDAKSAEDYARRLESWNEAGAPGGFWKPTDIRPKDMPPKQFAEQVDLIEPGNIDLDKRIPVRVNKGRIDTEEATVVTYTDKKDPNYGKSFLIPKIIKGKLLTESYAKRYFETHGEHLGVFKNDLAAKEYSKKLRERQAQVYGLRKEFEDWARATLLPSQDKPKFLGLAPTTGKTAAGLIDAEEPKPTGPQPTPVTQYSYGKSVGGPDEREDEWTNRGYSAGGRRNLTEGVAAVNPKKYPLGTVFRDQDSGKIFIASDTHSNPDPNVVDVFADPKNYQQTKQTRNFQVIDQIPEDEIPHTAEGIQKLTAEYNRGTGTKEPLIPGQPEPPVKINLDQRSVTQISSLRPEAQGVMQDFVSRAKEWAGENGLDVTVAEGFRTPERQAELYAQGRTRPGNIVTNAKPGQSKHQSARAVDLVVTRNGKPVDDKKVWQQISRIGKDMGLEWGGDWKSIYDPEHFQVPEGYRGPPKMRDWGIVSPGNIDIAKRPAVQNEDGTVSTIRSVSFKDDDGTETLIPSVINGQVVDIQEAISHYRSTGEHLGKFKTPEQATAYAQRISAEEGTRVEMDARHERLVRATERATGAIRTQLQEEGIIPVPRAELARTEKATLAKPKMTAAELLDAAEKTSVKRAADLVDGTEAGPVESKAQSWFLNALNSTLRGVTSEGALMAAEGAYAMQEAGTKATGTERLFSDSAEKRKKFAAMRDSVRETLHVDQEFATSWTGQILQGIGQLALLPLYALPGVGEVTSAAQLFQEARDDYKQTMGDKGTEEEANSAAWKYMTAAILPEAILNRFVLYRAMRHLIKQKKTVGQAAKILGVMAAEGGATEAFQQFELNTIAKHFEGYDPKRKLDKEVVASGIVGLAVSASAGTGAYAAGGVARKVAEKQRAPKPKTAAERQAEYEEKPGKMEEPVTLGATEQAAESTARKAEFVARTAESTATAAEQAAPGAVAPFKREAAVQAKWDAMYQRMVDEDRGHDILARIKEEGINPQDIVKEFWANTYPNLPNNAQKKFQRMIHSLTSFKPGDEVEVGTKSKDWSDLFTEADVSDNPRYLEGEERGLIVLMQLANEGLGQLKQAQATAPIERVALPAAEQATPVARTAPEKQPFLEPETAELKSGGPAVTVQETRERSQYEPGSRESVEYAADKVAKKFPGLPRIEVADTFEQIRSRFPEGAADQFSEEPVIFDRNLNRLIIIRDNMQDVPPEALQEYIARLAMSQAAPVGGISHMVAGTPQADVYQQALLRAFPELSKIDFGSGFADTFGYSNLVELAEAREVEITDPRQAARLIEEHASNVASMAGEKPRWFQQLVSDVQAITGTMGLNLSPGSAAALIEKSQPATEEHDADTESRMDAARAARDNPYVVTDMSGRELYPDVRLAGLNDIKIVEMPELLRLLRNITGGVVPFLKKYRKSLGMAYGEGAGRIGLHPDIFKDYVVAAKVAAHEIGHIIDYLAEGFKHPKHPFIGLRGMATKFPKMKETMKEQLIELTHWWKPWDEGTAPPGYTKYRKSDHELFADGFSVLVNSPAELKKRAPMFYHAFFDYLQGHKNVGDAYFELMAELHKPHMELLRTRNKNERQAMTDGAELWMAAKNKRKSATERVNGLRRDFMDQYYWKFSPSERLQRKLERAGIVVDPALDLRTMLDEHPLADNSVYTMFVRLQREVLEPLHKVGLTQQDLGVFLMHNRIMAGAYFDKAAPLGNNPKTSREALALMRHEIGLDRWQVLEHHAEYFHQEAFEIAKEMYMSGLISKDTFTNVIVPNQHTYATFRPIAHVEKHMTAGLQTVTGFLDDLENPFFSTVLKMVAMRRAIQWNRAKSTSISFLHAYYPELKKPVRAPGKGIDPNPSDIDHGIIKVKEDGVWKYYEVPVDFANQFKHPDHPSQTEAGARFLSFIFRGGFYQLFIRFNPYFQFVSSPAKDIQRLLTNMPKGTDPKLLSDAYLKAIPAAKRRLKGEIDPIVMEMYETMAISTPHDTFSRNFAKDDPFEMMMQEFHMLKPADKAAWRKNKLVELIEALGEKLIFGGQVMEAAPKIAAYEILTTQLGWSRKRSAAYIRNKIGVPNYMKKGSKALTVGALMPFWTVGLQGFLEDFKLMRGVDDMPALNAADIRAKEQGPDRRKAMLGMLGRAASWWLKWATVHGIYALFQGLAKEGLLGDDLEELFSGVGDYQHTNKMIIPLGKVEGGEFGYKSAFAAIPQDEMSKVVSALLKKVIHAGATRWKDEPHDPLLNEIAGLFSTVRQAVPGMHPLIKISNMWSQYGMRLNPFDEFKGRHILTSDQYEAGGWESIKPMLWMMVDESGVTNLIKFNPEPDSTTEAIVTNIPIFNRMFMVSDQGLREKQSNDISDPKADAARLRLQNLPPETAALLHEYNGIKRLGKHRTQYQEDRFKKLKIWHKNIYKPTFDRAAHYRDLGGDPGPMLRALEDQAERWKD